MLHSKTVVSTILAKDSALTFLYWEMFHVKTVAVPKNILRERDFRLFVTLLMLKFFCTVHEYATYH